MYNSFSIVGLIGTDWKIETWWQNFNNRKKTGVLLSSMSQCPLRWSAMAGGVLSSSKWINLKAYAETGGRGPPGTAQNCRKPDLLIMLNMTYQSNPGLAPLNFLSWFELRAKIFFRLR